MEGNPIGLRHKGNPLESYEENFPMELIKTPYGWNQHKILNEP